MIPAEPITNYAPTAYSTGSSLSNAASGLERLLNLAVGGYTAVQQAKNQATAAKLSLAQANASGVTPPPAPADSAGLGISPKVLVLGALAIGAAVIGVAALRK